MKTLKCNQLGGPETCQHEFHADTFEDIAQQSKQHGMDMFEKKDDDHFKAMETMKQTMQNPQDFANWMEEKKKLFNEKEEDR